MLLKNSQKIKTNNLLTYLFIAICLSLSMVFPTRDVLQDYTKEIFFLLVLPILYAKFVLKRNIADFGLNLADSGTGIRWAIAMFFASCLIALGITNLPGFGANFKVNTLVIGNFWAFLVSLLVFANLNLFLYEYFFRGFIISYFRRLALWSVVIEFALFLTAILVSHESPLNLWQLTPYLIAAATGGIVAYKSRSMLYSYFSNLIFFIFFYAYIIYSIKLP